MIDIILCFSCKSEKCKVSSVPLNECPLSAPSEKKPRLMDTSHAPAKTKNTVLSRSPAMRRFINKAKNTYCNEGHDPAAAEGTAHAPTREQSKEW